MTSHNIKGLLTSYSSEGMAGATCSATAEATDTWPPSEDGGLEASMGGVEDRVASTDWLSTGAKLEETSTPTLGG